MELLHSKIKVDKSFYEFRTKNVEEYFSISGYIKKKGKTDSFYLYEIDEENKKSIILFNEASLSDFNSGSKSKIISLKQRPWFFQDLLTRDDINSLDLSLVRNHEHKEVKKVLNYDSMTEGDSLRIFNYIVSSGIHTPDELWSVLLLWLRDEQNHHRGFESIYSNLFERTTDERRLIDEEPSNFEPFKKILSDPFKILVSLAYDEAATISGYLNDMPIYEDISPKVAKFVEKVISDEGWHLSKFAAMAAKYWPDRLEELDDILEEASNSDGKEYQRTFFLDHDPSVESQFDHELVERAVLVSKKIILAKGKIKDFNDLSEKLNTPF